MKRISKRIIALGMSALMAAGTVQPVSAAGTEAIAKEAGDIKIDPTIEYQTLEGWGTTLAWFANITGGWTQDFNSNGRADREDLAELLFSPEYLNLNIVRYNIGGGENPEHDHMKRVEGKVPGWKTSEDSALDPTADANQIWFLEKANEYRDDIINQVFSNSPPYYMTKSECATGNEIRSQNNLKEDCYDDFAEYLAEVTAWLDKDLKDKYGTGIDYIDPLNEPASDYWGAGSTKQEGCHFDPGESQTNILLETASALKAKGLNDVNLTGSDEFGVSQAVNSFNQLSLEAKKALATISTHTYNSSNREVLSDLAASYDKGLWMSEICMGDKPHNPESMSATSSTDFSTSIMNDLNQMQMTAWVDWQIIDSEYECLHTNENWGLIHAVFEEDGPVPDYHTKLVDAQGQKLDGVPDQGEWHISKQFYTMMQYSKFLKAGYTVIEIGDANMTAALSPNRDELVIVASNSGATPVQKYVDLSNLQNIEEIEAYRTSDEENCESINVSVSSNDELSVSSPAASVTTFVIKGKGSLVDGLNYTKRINSGVVSTSDTLAVGAGSVNKFAYTGSGWSRLTSQGTSYKSDSQATGVDGDSVTFTFNSNRAVLMGTMGTSGGFLEYSIDGGTPVTVDTYADETLYNQVLVDTGELASGNHTITVTLASGGSIAIDEAIIYEEHEPVVLESLRITEPGKKTYKLGDSLDLTGMVVTAVYSNGSTEVVTADSVTGFDSKTAGTKTITVAYQGVTARFTVTVNEAVIDPVKNPTGVKAVSAGYNSIKLTWNKVAAASGYDIYRSTSKNGTYSKIKTVSGSAVSYTDSNLTVGKIYYYKIKAYKTVSGKQYDSEFSAVANAKPILAVPKVTLRKAGKKGIKATWKKVTGASGYEVKYSTKKSSGYKTPKLKKPGKLSFKKTGLKKGKTYYVRVRAYRKVSGKKVFGSWSVIKQVKL